MRPQPTTIARVDIPAELFAADCSAEVKCAAIYLWRQHDGRPQTITIQFAELAAALNRTCSSARRWVTGLEEIGLIEVSERPRGGVVAYLNDAAAVARKLKIRKADPQGRLFEDEAIEDQPTDERPIAVAFQTPTNGERTTGCGTITGGRTTGCGTITGEAAQPVVCEDDEKKLSATVTQRRHELRTKTTAPPPEENGRTARPVRCTKDIQSTDCISLVQSKKRAKPSESPADLAEETPADRFDRLFAAYIRPVIRAGVPDLRGHILAGSILMVITSQVRVQVHGSPGDVAADLCEDDLAAVAAYACDLARAGNPASRFCGALKRRIAERCNLRADPVLPKYANLKTAAATAGVRWNNDWTKDPKAERSAEH